MLQSACQHRTLCRTSSDQVNRNFVIAGGVVLFHVGALWALQSGLVRRAIEVVVPVEVLSQYIEPPKPKTEPPPPPPPPPAPPAPPAPLPTIPTRQPVVKRSEPVPPPAPMPVAVADASPNAPVGLATPQLPPPPITAPVVAAPVPPPAVAPPAPAKVELPSSAADYLQNPRPAYPPVSKRLGEQGKVLIRVLISVDGTAKDAEVRQSSGFDRLDQAALATVKSWRYVPGKRGGVAEAMWFTVPINFVLE
jgi:periplasmic protein TonB